MKRGLLLSILLCCTIQAFAKSPIGLWTTIDDKTGNKRSEVRLSLNEDKELSGKIVRVFTQEGDTGICKSCPGKFRGKPIKGLRILWGLTENQDGSWTGGEILDPKSGKLYNVKLTEKGNKLYVRGYVGFSLLGRTQIWERA